MSNAIQNSSEQDSVESQEPKTIYLNEYAPPAYQVKSIHLDFDIHEANVNVIAVSQMRRVGAKALDLELDGNQQQLVSIEVNDTALTESQYSVSATSLVLKADALDFDDFKLTIKTTIDPYNNTSLEGLYESKGMLCTQCEAEGFRRMTYYMDRPDNMAIFTTRIEADQKQYPVLLSNGNVVEQQQLENGRHSIVWHDPFPKPCYLFALVAGDLAVKQDQFVTQSGREVTIAFYTDPQDQNKIQFAIDALKKSMRWDEERYGCEYDLDIYMVVAVSHFNMGAMENKGLNIFNTRCVLASPETTTDQQYASVESIIAHEYFHNWSGNRITCRDWFQLSLKEGFTVFRDQHFSMDVDSWLEHRIGAVKVMRSIQFAEDGGPMAHPVRPQSYIEINNFYTVTVYDKGAEVVRLYQTLLGQDAFRRGTDRYFKRFDGQAVTTEDFMNAVTEGEDFDRAQFQRWYDQPGTPVVTVHRNYDAQTQELRLRFEQHYPELAHWNKPRLPVIIPVQFGVVTLDGMAVPLRTGHTGFRQIDRSETDGLFLLKGDHDEICLSHVPEGSVPSLLRGFSAPVVLKAQLSLEELALLVAHDEDTFNRWDAAQQMMNHVILEAGENSKATDLLIESLGSILNDPALEPETQALLCQMPAYAALEQVQMQSIGSIDVDRILDGQDILRFQVATALEAALFTAVQRSSQALDKTPYDPSATGRGWRSLRNLAFYYLARLKTDKVGKMLVQHYQQANNLTDRLAALRCLLHVGYDSAPALVQQFVEEFGHEELAMNAWFEVQASNPEDGAIARVQLLQQHQKYDEKSPNDVRSVIGSFCRGNPRQFHLLDKSGYEFLATTVLEYNVTNPQLAARLLGPLIGWKNYDPQRQVLMQQCLQQILACDTLAPDVFEIASRSVK